MGEFADMLIADMWDQYWDHDWEDDPESCPPSLKTCRYCATGDLRWGKVTATSGWRLFDNRGKMHTCSKFKSK